ncbi:MAG: 2-deoxy-D-gluconate 3-dehydrogenase [Pseudopedobacter saltans]|uniref:2-deoxy-D-gluconate 3-dehydrogenase n=1 Tax=Pseudopedobacter saltans TaxID=151895 RepID=A0A2W5EVL5_9SPHI|nr:MAG: 2-deoxy-D-gluconate 3-dehydrogenase [Pseudopedobacter saltans]
MFDLSGKTALVTGCDKGIGKGMALALAAAGANIIGVSRSLKDDQGIPVEVRALGRSFYSYQADLSEREAVYSFIEKVKAEHPTIDILVNNAGTIMRKPVAEHPDEYWDKVLSINLDAVFILTREFGKEMIAKGSGKVIFTCSMLSYQGGINVPGYTASKSAIAGLVKAFANEWAGKGVHVNGIAPGYIATDNTAALRDDQDRSKSILERIPSGRWGTPDDFAGATIFLASEASNYVDGTILNVDGGWMGR